MDRLNNEFTQHDPSMCFFSKLCTINKTLGLTTQNSFISSTKDASFLCRILLFSLQTNFLFVKVELYLNFEMSFLVLGLFLQDFSDFLV